MKVDKKNNKGFTLIELLVVIAIISILSSVILASLNTARAKARDARRLADLHSIQNALELYYNDHGQYPSVCGASVGFYAPAWPNVLSSPYIGSMPNDPTNVTGQYGYYYCDFYQINGNCGFSPTPGVKTDYILATRLENPSVSSHSCSGVFGGWDNTFLNYIVGAGP